MNEVAEQVVLSVLTAALAVVILVPTFVVLNWLLELGLDVALPAVVGFGILLAYVLNWDKSRS